MQNHTARQAVLGSLLSVIPAAHVSLFIFFGFFFSVQPRYRGQAGVRGGASVPGIRRRASRSHGCVAVFGGWDSPKAKNSHLLSQVDQTLLNGWNALLFLNLLLNLLDL